MNLYCHFPFCRAKCAYCALPSRAGSTAAERARHVAVLADEIAAHGGPFGTVYFGGGTPALCDLTPLFVALAPRLAADAEFTVELHPRDATPALADALAAGGVTRVSFGVQSFDADVLAAMGREYDAESVTRAFAAMRAAGLADVGLDLIAGWPRTSPASWRHTLALALALEPTHVSVYSLIREPRTRLDRWVREGRVTPPSDDEALDAVAEARATLVTAGFERYEISNYALGGKRCRHNVNVWKGEDYLGLGAGARGRMGLTRTRGVAPGRYETEALDEAADALERALFSLRTFLGVDLSAAAWRHPLLLPRHAAWRDRLDALVAPGILRRVSSDRWLLTPRGAEVCDAVLAELDL